ncbi:MAG TPA: hypothetical protein VM537_30080 [Anaerolineae bacterium]|nr:hypothetical protein [Anaerolineae bacterium]
MTLAKIEGNTITETRNLHVARMCLVNSADDLMIDAGNDGWILHAAPGAGCCWVIGSVEVAFALMPTAPFRLEIWYNAGAGNVVVYDSYVGTPPAAAGTDVNSMGAFSFNWPVSRRFPENAQVRVTLYNGDVLVAASLNLLSWVEDLA